MIDQTNYRDGYTIYPDSTNTEVWNIIFYRLQGLQNMVQHAIHDMNYVMAPDGIRSRIEEALQYALTISTRTMDELTFRNNQEQTHHAD
jgi:hypothetical protein